MQFQFGALLRNAGDTHLKIAVKSPSSSAGIRVAPKRVTTEADPGLEVNR